MSPSLRACGRLGPGTGGLSLARLKATVALLFLAMILALPRPSAADSEESFRRGFQALDRKRYNEAAGHMRDAIRERPAEGGAQVRITGAFFSPYLPHYYLGVALFRIGDCAGAVREWRESQRQGMVTNSSEAGTLKSLEEQCLGPLVEKGSKAAEEELEKAHRLDRELREIMEGPEGREPVSGNRGFVQRARNAEEALAKVNAKLDEGKAAGDPDSLATARDLAAQTARQLRGLSDEATSLIAAWRKLQPRSQPTPAGAEPSPRREPPPRAEDTNPLPAVPARTLPAPAQSPGLPAPPAPPPAKPPASAAPGPPDLDQLRAAAGAFFAADYPAALLVLGHVSFSNRRMAAQATLFSAAARMAIYWLGSGRDAALLRRAQEDIRRCKRFDPLFHPPRSAFSPRFIAFFDAPR